MDDYIVRIIRRDAVDPEGVIGFVEIVRDGEWRPFHCFEQLLQIIVSSLEQRHPANAGERRQPSHK